MGTLLVAAGGGGDAITAAALATQLNLDAEPVILTYSWDRLLVDPLPGPRCAAEFRDLRDLAEHVAEIAGCTRSIPPAHSSLPRLAHDIPARLLLLDPSAGAIGLASQIKSAAMVFERDRVVVVDVGGDILTTGAEPGLRSPLADQLALAACDRAAIATEVAVVGPGIDGELPADVVADRLGQLDARYLTRLSSDGVQAVRAALTWHPSEASGMVMAAASGCRGRVEVRDAGTQVQLTENTASVLTVEGARLVDRTPARLLVDTSSLAEAADRTKAATGISELDYERLKASRRDVRAGHIPSVTDLPAIDRYAWDARERGAQYVSIRRLAELVGVTTFASFTAFVELLRVHRPDRLAPSLYRV